MNTSYDYERFWYDTFKIDFNMYSINPHQKQNCTGYILLEEKYPRVTRLENPK